MVVKCRVKVLYLKIKNASRFGRQQGKRVNLKTKLARKQSMPRPVTLLKKRLQRKCYVFVLGAKKCSIFGRFGVFCFHIGFVFRFAILTYYHELSISNYNRRFLTNSRQINFKKRQVIVFRKSCETGLKKLFSYRHPTLDLRVGLVGRIFLCFGEGQSHSQGLTTF